MCQFVENPERSVLCIGHISRQRLGDATTSLVPLVKRYEERLRLLYRSLAAEGYDTYIFTSWDRFDILAAMDLLKNKPGMIADYGLEYVYSMGIFEASRPFAPTPPPYMDYLDEVIVPQEDDDSLTTEELFNTILSEVSVVLYDNADHDSFVRAILDKAVSLGKRIIDINSCAD
jgi:hypothetical protein